MNTFLTALVLALGAPPAIVLILYIWYRILPPEEE